jgi:sucrose phosphorylase
MIMLNAYQDSIGTNLSDIVSMSKCHNSKTPFLNFMFYQPFSSDLDRGFSIINYDINEEWFPKKI